MKVKELESFCERHSFYVATYSPGDGRTRYRFFSYEVESYFAGYGDYTALGYREAVCYALGRAHGVQQSTFREE